MTTRKTTKDTFHKPLTDSQYETLTNEFIVRLNNLCEPEQMHPEFVGAILANAIHSVDAKGGFVTKEKLFDTVVDLIAKRLSFQISEGIRLKAEAEKKAKEETPTDELPAATVPQVEAPSH